MDYGEILDHALVSVVEDFEKGRIALDSEADLRSWLFSACARRLKDEGAGIPLPLHAEKRLRKKWIPDLVLGPDPNEGVELKLQTVDGDSIFLKPSGRSDPPSGSEHSIHLDIEKVCDYATWGMTGHFIFVEVDDGSDADWYWPMRIDKEGWIPKSAWREGAGLAWVHHVVPATSRGRP